MGAVKHAARRVLARALALLCVSAALLGAASPVSEYQLKAVFLFNFAQFIEWPASAMPREHAPFIIGVLGKDPFGAQLDEIVRDEKVSEHPLSVVRYHDVAEVHDCQILFIAASELPRLEGILAALKGRSILTVTDAEAPVTIGVMIALVRQEKRVKLRIDLEAARAGNLTISSKLLRPAEIVGSRS